MTISSSVYCLKNRLENATQAISSLIFHLDMALEDYPNGHPTNKKHLDLFHQLEQQVLKIRQLQKQFVKTKKEISKILDLDYY